MRQSRRLSTECRWVTPSEMKVMPWCGCCSPAAAAEMAPQGTSGNPRNKVALKPGHSLMDWVRLGHSGVDLSGIGGALRDVTPQQLAAHSKARDAWLAIRGRVYNVTHYMDFHPGGQAELMRGVGKDGTELFNQIHPWVNYESLLQKCLVGRLVAGPPPRNNLIGRLFPKKDPAVPIKAVSMNWHQQLGTVTLQFSTKGPPPQARVMLVMSHKDLVVNITLGSYQHVTHVILEDGVCWPPCKVSANCETGAVEVQLSKGRPTMWQRLGSSQDDNGQVKEAPQQLLESMEVVGVSRVTHNTRLLLLRHKQRIVDTVPIGYSVHLSANIGGEEVVRSYTPIAAALDDKFLPPEWNLDCLCLMVKECSGGRMSPYLCNLEPGDVLNVSQPVGSFQLSQISGQGHLCLLAAGSGFTPMVQIILWALSRKHIRKVVLLFFNVSERDILWKDQLDALAVADSRFLVTYVLTSPDSDWTGQAGELTLEGLRAVIQKDSFVCVCGPDTFREASVRFLGDIQHPRDLSFVF